MSKSDEPTVPTREEVDAAHARGNHAEQYHCSRALLAEVERLRNAHNGEVCVDTQEHCEKLEKEVERLRKWPPAIVGALTSVGEFQPEKPDHRTANRSIKKLGNENARLGERVKEQDQLLLKYRMGLR